MDILTIATREADQAYEAEQTNEAAYDAYRKAFTETLARGRKAEDLLEAGLISPNGGASSYYVHSQNGGGTYHVDLDAQTCTCPDHEHRETYCKHLQAAELYADQDRPEDFYRDLIDGGDDPDLAAAAVDAAYGFTEVPDPMAPDWEALGNEPLPATAWSDSREAAGLPSGRPITTGYTYTQRW
jgi:hypothetical protein